MRVLLLRTQAERDVVDTTGFDRVVSVNQGWRALEGIRVTYWATTRHARQSENYAQAAEVLNASLIRSGIAPPRYANIVEETR